MKLEDLGPAAITLIVVATTIGTGAIILSETQQVTYTDNFVENETHTTNLSSTDSEKITVNNVKKGVERDSEVIYDPYNPGTTLTEGENYSVINYRNGEFNITNYYENKDAQQDIAFNYTYHTTNTESGVVQQGLDALDTFGNFFTVLAIVVIGAIVIGLLMTFRGSKQTMV